MGALGFSIGVGVRQRRASTSAPAPTPTPSYSVEAQALFARMSVQPDAARKGQVDALILALKSAGLWAKLDCFYLLAGHDPQAARLNWKGASFDLSEVNAPAFTPDRGYAGNGTSSYLDTGFNPGSAAGASYALNSAHVGVWSRTNLTVAEQFDIGAIGTPNAALNCRSSNANAPRGAVNTGSLFNGGSSPDSLGHFVLSRTAAAASQHYRNGAALGSASTAASSALPNANLRVCSAGAANFSARQLAAAHVGAGLSGGEVASLHDALSTYMAAVGA